MSEGRMEVIDLDDSDNDDEEDSDDTSSESEEEEKDENMNEDIVILSEHEYSQSDGEETSGSDAAAGEPDSSSDESDIQEIQYNNFPEPGIILESMPVPEPITEEPSTSTGSKLPLDVFNIDEYDCFVDPDDESETSKRKENILIEEGSTCNVLDYSEQPDILPFCDDIDAKSFSETSEEELIALSPTEDEFKDDRDIGDVISKEAERHYEEQLEPIEDSLVFKIVGPKIFIKTESLKDFAPDVNLETVIEKADGRGWNISDCFQFSGWELDYIRLELAEMILPKGSKLAEMIRQLLPSRSSVNAALRSNEEKTGNINLEPEPVPLILEQEEDQIVEDQQPDSPAPAPDVLEVTQTREMKRKGIKLPKGWKILGVKRQSEICNNGESYQYFRIDWEFKSPDGRSYQNLKKVLSIIKQKSGRFEKWEVGKTGNSNNINQKSSIGEHYRTLKKQYEDELDRVLDTDVFAVSGIRPVRKFPVNFEYPVSSQHTASPESSKDMMPSRMSAMLKANPVSLAQREKMMRKAGPAIRRFSLSKVSGVCGLDHEGWFSSKLMAMSYLSKCKTSKFANVKIVPSLSESDFILNGKKVKLRHIDDGEIAKIKDLTDYLISRGNTDHPEIPQKLMSRAVSRCEMQQEMPNFNRKVIKKIDEWPKNWLRKVDYNLISFISPDGSSFDNVENAVECLHSRALLKTQTNGQKKTFTPNKRKLFNLELPQKSSSVIRKLPITCQDGLSVSVKKLKMSEQDIEAMVTRDEFCYSSSDDSLEDLLSGSDGEIS